MNKFKIEAKPHVSVWSELLAILAALVASFAVCAIIVLTTSHAKVSEVFLALFQGAFGSKQAVLDTLVQATPLIFTGLATVVAFRGRVWNIGGEGQYVAGAIIAAWLSISFGGLPRGVALPLVLIGSMIGGAIWAFIPGYLKAKFGSNEIIITVMMNYIILFILSYLLSGPWKDPNSYYLQTISFSQKVTLPTLFNSNLHVGFILALAFSILVFILLWKTPLGYEIRSIGVNLIAARYKGVDVAKTIVLTMIISGVLAGLAGGVQVSGVLHRVKLDISVGYGFTGILIAMMGRLNPYGAVLAAIFYGALDNGATYMQIITNVPVALIQTFQGIILFFLIISFVLMRYRVRRIQDGK